MKRNIFFITMIFIMIFSLTACNFSDLEDLEIEIFEENIKSENLIKMYNINKTKAVKFDKEFMNMLFLEYEDFSTKIIEDIDFINNYLDEKSGYFTVFMSLKGGIYSKEKEYCELMGVEKIDSYFTEETVKSYHFLDKDNGTFSELIIITLPNVIYHLNLEWQNGKIIFIDLESV